MPPATTPPWTTELFSRMRELFVLKTVGTTVWIWLFFLGYFYLLRHPAYPVTMMPLTALDHLIDFQPAALFPYLSLWVYVGVAPGVQRGFRDLLVYGLWAGALCIAGLALFYFWPTQVPPLAVDVSGEPGFRMLQGIDAAGNACPSMHVAISVFTAIWVDHVFRRIGVPLWLRSVNWAWCLAIAWSTIATRQHVALDVYGGVLLGAVFAFASLRWRPAPAGSRAPVAPAAIMGRR